MMIATEPDPSSALPTFSLVRDDALLRLQRRLRLLPPGPGLGVGRRALVLALVTWLPIVAWAAATGRAAGARVAEPLLEHFGVHVRCLVAIPLLVLADATAHAATSRLLPYFVTSGLVAEAQRGRFETVLRDVARLRDRWFPWAAVVALVAAWTVLRPLRGDVHEVRWAANAMGEHVGFGGWWFLDVVRPLFTALLLGWMWRLGLLGILLRRISRLELSLVPTHPDRMAGLGFLSWLPLGFAPVLLAVSAVAASRWGHDVVYHDVSIESLRAPAAALAIVFGGLVLLPLFSFRGALAHGKRRALLEYGALIGEHGRRVRRRWILREPVADADALLAAPELGPVADTTAIYDAVSRMRTIPVGVPAVAAVLLPLVLPMLAVVALRVPVKDVLLRLLKILL